MKKDLAFRQVKINYQRQEGAGGDNCAPDSQTKSTSTSYAILVTPTTGCDDNTALIAGLTAGVLHFSFSAPELSVFVFLLLLLLIFLYRREIKNQAPLLCCFPIAGLGGAAAVLVVLAVVSAIAWTWWQGKKRVNMHNSVNFGHADADDAL